MPRVSVIMPVYNEEEHFLRLSIESILKQTFTDFEFIIINDGSTNNVENVVLSYNDSRIVYIKNEINLKIIKTLNKGLLLAKGEYIARMDADDISSENRLELQVKYLDENPSVAAVGTFAVGTPGNLRYQLPVGHQDIKLFMRYCANCVMHPTIMMRKAVLDAENLNYKEDYPHAEDYKLWCDLLDKHEINNISEYLFVHRLHQNSVSAKNLQLQNLMADKILFECLEKDFKPNKQVKDAFLAYIKGAQISSLQLCAVDKFFCNVLKRISKKIFTNGLKTLNDRYYALYLRFVMLAKYDIFFLFSLYFGGMNRYYNLSFLQKLKLHVQKLETQSQQTR